MRNVHDDFDERATVEDVISGLRRRQRQDTHCVIGALPIVIPPGETVPAFVVARYPAKPYRLVITYELEEFRIPLLTLAMHAVARVAFMLGGWLVWWRWASYAFTRMFIALDRPYYAIRNPLMVQRVLFSLQRFVNLAKVTERVEALSSMPAGLFRPNTVSGLGIGHFFRFPPMLAGDCARVELTNSGKTPIAVDAYFYAEMASSAGNGVNGKGGRT